MHRADDRPTLQRDTVLFLACMLLSIAALLLPTDTTRAIATTIRETALFPLVRLQAVAEEGRSSRARVQAAVAQRDSAWIAAVEAEGLRQENDRLRVLLDLPARYSGPFVAADVLWQTLPTDGRTLLLSAGTREGVRAYSPVVTPDGLVGAVTRPGRTNSVATTWAHPEFRVSGVTADGEVLGVVAPSPSADPSLTVLEFRGTAYRDTVPEGTLVLTAGLGGVYPQGIPIGTVRRVRREETGWERVYELTPAVNLGLVRHVLLLLAPVAPTAPLADSLR